MNGLSATILLILVIGVLLTPRKWALVSMVAGVLYLTYGAGIQIAGMNVQPTRLLAYLCFLRVVARRELPPGGLLRADKALILLYSFTTAMLLARSDGSVGLALAKALDGILTYLVFRALIQTFDDFKWIAVALVALLVPYVAILAVERVTQNNLFTFVGSAAQPWIRDGKLRCCGSFRHPSLLGSLGACFLPVCIGLIADPALRRRMAIGCVLCIGVVIASNSGGPLGTLAAAIVGWLLWPLRTRMKQIRWLMLVTLIGLAMVMKAPVWYLISRVGSFTGGTAWHRSYLMDVAFRNFDQWALAGMPVESTAGWLPYTLPATGGADITNQYLTFGIQGGVIAILLFIYFIYAAFSYLGRALEQARRTEGGQTQELILWGLGVALAAHISNWFGIAYFDQFHTLWLLQMGALVSLSQSIMVGAEVVHERASEPVEQCESDAPVVTAQAQWRHVFEQGAGDKVQPA